MGTLPVVLDEDTYADAISRIIERDFFPHLAKLRAQENYVQAQQSGTLSDLSKALHALTNSTTPPTPRAHSDRPVNFYNPDAVDLEDRVNLNLSLDQFQTVYTSEDNASFSEILERTNAKRREKLQWLFDKEKPLMIEAAPPSEGRAEAHLGTWKYQAKNALMYHPEGTGESYIDEKNARGPPKAIRHDNTHLITTAETSSSTTTTTAQSNPAATLWHTLSEGKKDYRGYTLVPATPSPNPSRMGTPVMTWGAIEGTPMLIQGSETPGGPRFSIPSLSKREELGKKLSEKASRAHRKRMIERLVKGTPRSGAGFMSPAAQHLLRRANTPRTTGFGDALRSSYGGGSATPLRGRTPGATPTPLFRAGATPTTSAFTPRKSN